jgi:hypothetical protein
LGNLSAQGLVLASAQELALGSEPELVRVSAQVSAQE